MRTRRIGRLGLATALAGVAHLACVTMPPPTQAQPARVYQVGVVLQGGPFALAVDGLRQGLKEAGLVEGKHFVLHVRDSKGDISALEVAAKALEGQKVDVIYSVSTSATLATRRATQRVPIVFYAGADPVVAGLVESFRKPGGRLTGVHGQLHDLTAKRFELLLALVPKARRIAAFYTVGNPAALASLDVARSTARQLKVQLVERSVASVDELRKSLHALRPTDADAILYVGDAMVTSQNDLVIEVARAKQLPIMLQEHVAVVNGALASYGISYYAAGQLSAKQVERILKGAAPGDLPVEQLARPYFAINLKTAKALGLTIPREVLVRADEVVE